MPKLYPTMNMNSLCTLRYTLHCQKRFNLHALAFYTLYIVVDYNAGKKGQVGHPTKKCPNNNSQDNITVPGLEKNLKWFWSSVIFHSDCQANSVCVHGLCKTRSFSNSTQVELGVQIDINFFRIHFSFKIPYYQLP